jgi:hypothetical protein
MAWSLPAKTGWRTRISTRSIMLDSNGMAIPLVMSHDDELSDLHSNLIRKSHTKIAGRVRSQRGGECLPSGRLVAGRSRRRAWHARGASGPSETRQMGLRFPSEDPSVTPARPSRQRVEGRTRGWHRLFWGIDLFIAPRTDGCGSDSSSSRFGRRGAPWADCCLWTTTRT